MAYFYVEPDKKKVDWKKFENDAAEVFEAFDYEVNRDVRFKTTRRFQIDFIASNEKRIFFIDCKDHAYIPPEKEYEFAKMQLLRAKNFKKIKTDSNPKNIIMLVTKYKTNSLLMHKAEIGSILSVDYESLPELLRNIHLYEDELFTF